MRRPGSYERIDNSPSYDRAACDAPLRRLGVLLYVHRVQPASPIEEVMGALACPVAEGLVGHVGFCEPSAATLRRAQAVHPAAAVQSEWWLWTREHEADVLPEAREIGAGLLPYSPLRRGFLTGALRGRPDGGRHARRASMWGATWDGPVEIVLRMGLPACMDGVRAA